MTFSVVNRCFRVSVDEGSLSMLSYALERRERRYKAMSEQTEKPIDAEQVAEMLGVKQARTVINMAKRGEIPAFRVGDLWRFYRSDIQAYIDEQRKQVKRREGES